jgi:hypothetical protein
MHGEYNVKLVWLLKLLRRVTLISNLCLPEYGTLAMRYVMQSGEMCTVNLEQFWKCILQETYSCVLANHNLHGKAEI